MFTSHTFEGTRCSWVIISLLTAASGCGGIADSVGSKDEAVAANPSEDPEETVVADTTEGSKDPDEQASEAARDAGKSAEGAPGADGQAYATFDAACALKEGGTFRADSTQEFLDTVIGVWILCTPTSAFSQEPMEVGLEIADDGTWYHLYGNSPTTMERGLGFLEEGTYDVIDTSDFNGPGWYQLNLNISGSGTVITLPQFTGNASLMALDNNGVHRGEYRKL